jgi:hypothetical protein
MFELVVGELDMILGRIDDEFDFERAVFDAFAHAEDDAPSRVAWTRSAPILVAAATPTFEAGWAWTRLSETSGGDPSWARLRLLVELPRSPRRTLGTVR